MFSTHKTVLHLKLFNIWNVIFFPGLLESGPTFREVERDVPFFSKENGHKRNSESNGSAQLSRSEDKRTVKGRELASQDDQTGLLNNDQFSDFDSL